MVPRDLTDCFSLSAVEASQLGAFDAILIETNVHTNLIARSGVESRWRRHYADSLQLWPLVPEAASSILDVGSGGGFPGIPLAILSQDRAPTRELTLCESVGKKAAFLRGATAAAGLKNVTVRAERAERLDARYDVVTARAVTALPRLLDLTVPLLRHGGVLIAPKGRTAEREVEEASERWRMAVKRVKSATDPEATILVLSELERRS